jgi:putative oxidoreductase
MIRFMFTREFTTDLALLVNRFIFGLFIVFGHGWGKLERLIRGDMQFSDVFGLPPLVNLILAVFAEVFCGLALIIGFRTRWASVPLILTMLVAAFVVHGNDPLFMAHAAGGGSKELAILFLVGFLISFLMGGGKYSLDYLVFGKRN